MIPERETKDFAAYLKGIADGKIHHKYYKKTVDHAEDMGVHVEGHKPKKLLTITRPNEPPDVKQYRLDIWEPVTKGSADKIQNTLNRIYNPKGFDISFQDGTNSQELEDYLKVGIPQYGHLMRYMTETFTTKNLSDPNGAIAIVPESFDIPPDQAFKPVPVFYPAETLADFKEDSYYTFVFKKKDKVVGERIKAVLIYTETTIEKYEPVEVKDTFNLTMFIEHGISEPPVFRTGGIIKGHKSPNWYFSYIGGVLPHWNRVITLSSDLDANYNSHLYMERWSYVSECTECEGTGNVEIEISGPGDCETVSCKRCGGTGQSNKSPYGEWKLSRDALNPDEVIPNPPAGFISKDTAIVTKIEERISQEDMKGFSSVNMEILNKVGENQSGIAKTIDRQDLDGFLLAYSDHAFNFVMVHIIEYMSWWIFGVRLNWSQDAIAKLQPEIVAPKEFNVLSLDFLLEEYKSATQANVSDNYLIQIEKDIINKKFASKEKTRKRNIAIAELQPFPGSSKDDLLTLVNLGTEDWEIYKSTHIIELVDRAINESEGFLDLNKVKQKEIIDNFAKEARPPAGEVIPVQE